MSNFGFLSTIAEFSAFAEAAANAEKALSVSPSTCALQSRAAAEAAVKWLYDHDENLTLPYKDNLSALIYNQSFVETVNPEVQESLRYVIKLGNLAAHTGKTIAYQNVIYRALFSYRCEPTKNISSPFARVRITSSAISKVCLIRLSRGFG